MCLKVVLRAYTFYRDEMSLFETDRRSRCGCECLSTEWLAVRYLRTCASSWEFIIARCTPRKYHMVTASPHVTGHLSPIMQQPKSVIRRKCCRKCALHGGNRSRTAKYCQHLAANGINLVLYLHYCYLSVVHNQIKKE